MHVRSAALIRRASRSTFVATDEDAEVLKKVQERFEVNIGEMPAQIDTTSYLNA